MSPQYSPPSGSSPRTWLIVVPTAGMVVLAVLWSAFWYYASGQAETAVASWRAHEGEAGRTYDCGQASFGGFPFRIEYNCADPAVDDRGAALSLRARNLAAVAQVWDPTLVIGEVTGPLTVAPLGNAPTAIIDWSLAQASLRARPGTLDRLSIVLDEPNLATALPGGTRAAEALVKARHAEFHARFASDSVPNHPVLDLALDVSQVTAPALVTALGAPFGALAGQTTDGMVVAVLRGADDLSQKPMAERLRAFQAAGGQLDITNARFTQGDLIATATGTLGLAPRGTLSGELRLTVINFEKLVPLLGVDRMLARVVPADTLGRLAPGLDRLVPGLGSALRGNGATGGGNGTATANAAAGALGAAALGGQPAELDGQRAVALTLHFDDGAAFLGPLKIGQVPPLY